MKILIFASPRSGSTQLTYALAKLFNFKYFLEPFNPKNIKGFTEDQINDKGNNIRGNTITKVLSVHRPREWYLEYIEKFDKVIYLTRNDSKSAIESFHWAASRSEHPQGDHWHTSYFFDASEVTINKWIVEHVTSCIEEVKTVAYINKKSYIIYEDLYSEDISLFNKALDLIDLSIDRIKLREILHPSKKYRKDYKLKTII